MTDFQAIIAKSSSLYWTQICLHTHPLSVLSRLWGYSVKYNPLPPAEGKDYGLSKCLSFRLNIPSSVTWTSINVHAPISISGGVYNHRHLETMLFGRKGMTNLDSVLKSKDITVLTKVHIVKAMIFPVIIYGCERWTIKKPESQRTDAFQSLLGESLGLQGDQTSQS